MCQSHQGSKGYEGLIVSEACTTTLAWPSYVLQIHQEKLKIPRELKFP